MPPLNAVWFTRSQSLKCVAHRRETRNAIKGMLLQGDKATKMTELFALLLPHCDGYFFSGVR